MEHIKIEAIPEENIVPLRRAPLVIGQPSQEEITRLIIEAIDRILSRELEEGEDIF